MKTGDQSERSLSKIAAVLLILSFLLFLIGFGSTSWAETNTNLVQSKSHVGLWRYCTQSANGKTSCSDFIDVRTSDWLKATQAFMVFALFSFFGAIALGCIVAFVPKFQDDPKMCSLAIAFIGITMAFQLIGVGTFGGNFQDHFNNLQAVYDNIAQPSWGLGVSAASVVLTFISLGMFVFDFLASRED